MIEVHRCVEVNLLGTANDSNGQRAGTDQSALSDLVRGEEDPVGAHRGRSADAERVGGELSRQVPRRVLERELVRESVGSTAEGGNLGAEVQPGATAFQFGISDPAGIRGGRGASPRAGGNREDEGESFLELYDFRISCT